MRRLRIAAAVPLLMLVAVAGARAYVIVHGHGEAQFRVADVGQAGVSVGTIEGTIAPGRSLAVPITVSNTTEWSVRVGSVSMAGVSGLPDGCPAAAFSFADVRIDRSLAAGDSASATGSLAMARDAPSECAGSTPTLALALGS